jgi:hypothetical protein
MMIKMIKTTNPTRIFPPVTKVPKVSTTLPASPSAKIARVVETFNPKRNKVNNKINDGKIENCNGSFIFIDVRMTNNAREILIIIKKLNNQPGNGMISIATIKMTLSNTDKSLADMFVSLLKTNHF